MEDTTSQNGTGTPDVKEQINSAVKQAADLLESSRDQVTTASVLMTLLGDDRETITAFIDRCNAQRNATSAVKAAALAARKERNAGKPKRVRKPAKAAAGK